MGGWSQGNQSATEQVNDAVVAVSTQIARSAPSLTSPQNGTSFSDISQMQLEWRWHRPLAPDEVFDVRVWREGEPPYGIAWTTDSLFDLRHWLLRQGTGTYYWAIAVLETSFENDQQSFVEISDISPTFEFTVDSNTINIFNVPEGFEAQMAGLLPLNNPSVIMFGPDGDLYALAVTGQIVKMIDQDDDGIFDDARILYSNDERLIDHAVGMDFYNDTIYVSSVGQISTVTDEDGDGLLETVTPIITDLPGLVYTFHSNNGIAFGPDDKLYISVGSSTDHGPIEYPLEASILRANPDGSDLEVFATGFRNTYDLAFSASGDLFGADNSPDALGPDLNYLPPEELNHIREGRDYGFPYVLGVNPFYTDVTDPVTELLTSSATSGLTVYEADQFPEAYRGIFIALYGTGAEYPMGLGFNTGQMIIHVSLEPTDDGTYTGTWQPFATFSSDQFAYHPIDVTVAPDGSLYVAEWTSSTVHRITYTGEVEPPITEAQELSEAHAENLELIQLGEAIYMYGSGNAPGCIGCHLLEQYRGSIGPSLRNIAVRAEDRIMGMSAEEYIRESIIDPNAFTVPGYSSGVMYGGYGIQLSDEEIDALVAYIFSLAE